ncbi:MAG: protease [Candidatus Saccharibacteria bacterium]
MYEVYFGCLVGGALFALVTIVFGDLLGDVFGGFMHSLSMDHLDFLSPMVLVGGITTFGGAGVMLVRHTSLKPTPVALIALIAAIALSLSVYFLYLKPMKNAENSTGYSINDLEGKIATVITTVPTKGCGEVLVKVGVTNTNHIACSLDGEEIPSGTRVVIGEVEDGILYVFRYKD